MSSARTFAAEFKALAAILHLSPGEKIFQFKEKLKAPIQTQLADFLCIDECFEFIIQKAINVNQVMFVVEKAVKKAAKAQNSDPSLNSVSFSSCPLQISQLRNFSSSDEFRNSGPSFSSFNALHHSVNPDASHTSAPHSPLSIRRGITWRRTARKIRASIRCGWRSM